MRRSTIREKLENGYIPEPNSGCWLWIGAYTGKGYGQITHRGSGLSAHRETYKLYKGPIPRGLFVCHKCDVTFCVNPAHLFLGTAKDNAQDMMKKGRNHKISGYAGIANFSSKLTDESVRSIRANSEPLKVLAKRYGVSMGAISRARTGVGWKHVE